jgi:hypothetical protein
MNRPAGISRIKEPSLSFVQVSGNAIDVNEHQLA